MAKNKTTETQQSVTDFINNVADTVKRNDSFRIVELLKKETGFEPKMWGPTIIGFGRYHYVYESGHEGDAPLAGFSPRKDAIVIYVDEFDGRDALLAQLGKCKTGKVCVYIKKLEDIDIAVLKKIIRISIKTTKDKYP